MDCQMRNISLLLFMQLFPSAVKAAGHLISQMLTKIRLRTPKHVFAFVCVCVRMLMPEKTQTELNKRRPYQSHLIAGDDKQNADTGLFSD